MKFLFISPEIEHGRFSAYLDALDYARSHKTLLGKHIVEQLSKSATISKMAFSTYIFEVLYISVIGRPKTSTVNLRHFMGRELSLIMSLHRNKYILKVSLFFIK